ncbi:MAG: IPT/TIG domain-containing protein [Bacteroidales bacterium]
MKTIIRTIIASMFISVLTISACRKGLEPEIVMITPDRGGISTEITIEGFNFEADASVEIDNIESSYVEVIGDVIYAMIPSGVTPSVPLDVTVINPGGRSATLEEAFTAIPPELDFVNSATKPSGIIGSTIILEGSAFGSLQGDSKIIFSDGAGGTVEATVQSADDWTDEFIITTVPSGTGDGPVYIETELGKSNEIEFMLATAATFSPSTISWSGTTSLPVAVSGHSANFVRIEDETSGDLKQFAYVTGGRNNGAEALNQALYGEIDTDGTIAEWVAGSTIPTAVSFHQSIAATPFNSKVDGDGYLFTLGGIDQDGTSVRTITRARINNDGSLGTWESLNEMLPQGIHAFGTALFRSSIYIAGGATSNNEPVSKVYKAALDTLGQLGEWHELAELPAALSHHGFLIFGANLYVAGGITNAADPDAATLTTNSANVYYARLDIRSGNINDAGWVLNSAALQKARSKHTTLVAGGNLFLSSGLYSAAAQGSSENIYAQINADGTVESFNGATGSNTLSSEGGFNLFNQAGISYIDANGTSHVMIIGGGDVSNQGTKSNNVLFY